jgi:hypothetical protein
MSAFDIAGAVVATPLAALYILLSYLATVDDSISGKEAVTTLVIATLLTAWAAFCIARLCGASL